MSSIVETRGTRTGRLLTFVGLCVCLCGLLAAAPAEEKPIAHAPRLDPISPMVVSRVPTAGKAVALTFDACSTNAPSHYDKRVTDVLVSTGTPATIFLGGRWIMDNEAHARELAANPLFELGNHTWDHPHLTEVTDERVKSELQRTQDLLYAVTGKVATLFRPPYGEFDSKVVALAAEEGLVTVEFDLPSGDPDHHATKEKLVEWVLHRVRPGSIIVMHINQHGWHTAEALPAIIEGLKKKGLEPVTVGELMRRGSVTPVAKPPKKD